MTEDIDVIIDPEYASDEELFRMIHTVMVEVGRDLSFGEHWINDSVALFLTQPARKSILAMLRNKILFSGLVKIYRYWQCHWSGAWRQISGISSPGPIITKLPLILKTSWLF
ncbi:predicted protein [Histoplasma capsulatum G186AR]|uniref:Uncharacterized protein n=2 Tax=Ajellomyces capsulatus TaxID=5037 RepID=C0NZH7_AJECG|nr:uncharacterized protein HCBG_08557 [Histoplasma capsulatum G186AR]EEH03225.1 predicted protein [Histoplasma capsulatum G186AR]KAG5290374.1 hypothetical protein I7I52_07374 [Histoplasma capsulatum]QSS72301.1 hypothetical protein I7I50_00105 [Histoplasma capsulatum G186AR]